MNNKRKTNTNVNNGYRVDNVDTLLSTTRSVVRRNYVRNFNERLLNSRLNGLINIRQIGETDTDFEYPVSLNRRIVLGDVTPASCRSTPVSVDDASDDNMWGKTEEHEAMFDICIKDCKYDTPQVKVREKLNTLNDILVAHLWHKFWYGNPRKMQYGLLNHELIQQIESPVNGNAGSSKWKDKTNSQIMQEIRKCIKYMRNPRILLSEKVYNEALSTGDLDTGTDRGCSLRIDCIKRMLIDQPDVNFSENSRIEFMEELDRLEMYAGSDVALVYDADEMALLSSGPIYLAADKASPKIVEQILSINTGGLEITSHDSAFLITGI